MEERIFIERKNSIAYAILAINSIYESYNKERTISDFIKEMETMFDLYEDQNQLMKLMKYIISKNNKLTITIDMKN